MPVAADCLKLNFPAAFSASLLAWGLLEFPDVSQASSQRCITAKTKTAAQPTVTVLARMHHLMIVWCMCHNLKQECCLTGSLLHIESTAALCVCITRATVRHDGSQTCITHAMLVLCSQLAGLLFQHHMTAKQRGRAPHQHSPLLSCRHSPFAAHTCALVLIEILIQCYNCRATLQLDRQSMLWTVCAGLPTTLCRTTMQTWPSQARLAMLGMTTRPGDGLRT